jgi:zinc-ribbon domain/Predicted membrane protein (DUF2127)
MYCDKCGAQLSAGAQYCGSCGKAVAPGAVPSGSAAASSTRVASAADGRVKKHVNLLAILWLASGVLRLLAVSGFMLFGRLFWPGHWAGPHWWGFDPFWPGGLFTLGIFLGFFGVLHLILAWGLFERQHWGRTLGIVLGILALIRPPFGTVLGIYTLWVLAPESSAREWNQITQGGGHYGAAGVSASR